VLLSIAQDEALEINIINLCIIINPPYCNTIWNNNGVQLLIGYIACQRI